MSFTSDQKCELYQLLHHIVITAPERVQFLARPVRVAIRLSELEDIRIDERTVYLYRRDLSGTMWRFFERRIPIFRCTRLFRKLRRSLRELECRRSMKVQDSFIEEMRTISHESLFPHDSLEDFDRKLAESTSS